MERASDRERRYFERIGAANRATAGGGPPATLAEAFDRLERMAEQLGPLTRPGVEEPGDGDLGSHLGFLERLRTVGRERPPAPR